MEHIEQSILINTSIERAFHFHDDTHNLLKITPQNVKVTFEISGPFQSWKQTRLFREVGAFCELTDIVEYEPPFGILGRIADALLIRRQVMNMFAFRQQATKRLLESS